MGMSKAKRVRASIALAAAIAASTLSGPTMAQDGAPPPPPPPGETPPAESREIVIIAPRTLPPAPGRNSQTGAAIITTTVRIPVLYGDLDLTKATDADRFLVRLNNVVRDACLTLDRMQPFNPDPECADEILPGATATAKATIAAVKAAKAGK